MFHIAATLGYTVAELDERLSFQEYLGWVNYFEEMNKGGEDKKPNLLENEDAMLAGFNL